MKKYVLFGKGGFLGAFTTFSTMCKETVQLMSSGLHILAFLYILLSILLGLGAAWLGYIIVPGVKAEPVKLSASSIDDRKNEERKKR